MGIINKMSKESFDTDVSDAQATAVKPVTPEEFDFAAYQEYERQLLQRCRSFWQADAGVLVYRRMRVAEVFSYGCRDMKSSLAWQLGALQKSMAYPADVPNFLEPWYGIGTVAACFGQDYIWEDGQAPAMRPKFQSVTEALEYPAIPVAKTAIGKHTLEMIDYFLNQCDCRLPMSLCDIQSPLNVAGYIVDMTGFFTDVYDKPEQVRVLLNRLADLLVEFNQEQLKRIGDLSVWPGHGFASCRAFDGLGLSDDNSLMLSNKHYRELAAPALARAGKPFGGAGFHSCGNWTGKIEVVKQIKDLRWIDAAFSAATDPEPCSPEPFGKAFSHTGVTINARTVGDANTVVDAVRRLWQPGLKLVAVTYCQSPEEQKLAYEQIHQICQDK
jgi:hypothetical protein